MQPCSSPPSVTNGFFVIAKGSYSNGDQISYYCKMGYELTGTATRSCDGATGAWSGSTPKCTAATTIASVTTTTESPSQITGRFCCYIFGFVVFVWFFGIVLHLFCIIYSCKDYIWGMHGDRRKSSGDRIHKYTIAHTQYFKDMVCLNEMVSDPVFGFL